MTELVETGTTEIAANNLFGNEYGFGAAEKVTAQDIKIHSIRVAQALSDIVDKGEAKKGDIYNTLTNSVIAELGGEVEVIILDQFKYWVVKEGEDFKERLPAVGPNEYEWEEGNLKRDYHHSYYVLLTNEIAEGSSLIYELPFRKNAHHETKNISSYFLKLRSAGQPSFAYTFKIKAEEKENKTGKKYFVPKANLGRPVTEAEVPEIKKWLDLIKNINIDNLATTPEAEAEVDSSEPRY